MDGGLLGGGGSGLRDLVEPVAVSSVGGSLHDLIELGGGGSGLRDLVDRARRGPLPRLATSNLGGVALGEDGGLTLNPLTLNPTSQRPEVPCLVKTEGPVSLALHIHVLLTRLHYLLGLTRLSDMALLSRLTHVLVGLIPRMKEGPRTLVRERPTQTLVIPDITDPTN